jgi:hypothetical protein
MIGLIGLNVLLDRPFGVSNICDVTLPLVILFNQRVINGGSTIKRHHFTMVSDCHRRRSPSISIKNASDQVALIEHIPSHSTDTSKYPLMVKKATIESSNCKARER